MRTKRSFRNKGQIMGEYAVMIALIFAVLVALIPTLRAFFGGFFLNKSKQIGEGTPFIPTESTGSIGSARNSAYHTVETNGGFKTDTYTTDHNDNNTNLSTPL